MKYDKLRDKNKDHSIIANKVNFCTYMQYYLSQNVLTLLPNASIEVKVFLTMTGPAVCGPGACLGG